ncbi:general stress protein [Virgibacillus sp. C22-A2]|uniref:General stress protein n=1 Tax=Virgibacillus tibetensis TaxID=3042313 RepID=A0ABU6KF85_9BACI|nr:general stress protein [Virgibacillus sp. C22-A2]
MGKEIFGPYQSKDDAINSVNGLELKGYKADSITIFTNQRHTKELKQRTDVKVESSISENGEENSPLDKLKRIFTNDSGSHPHLHDKLLNSSISDKQAKKYVDAIESGEILIIADNQLRMGHDSTSDTVTLEEAIIQRNDN